MTSSCWTACLDDLDLAVARLPFLDRSGQGFGENIVHARSKVATSASIGLRERMELVGDGGVD